MTTQTVKLNKEKVDFLPKDLQKAWEGADVFVVSSEDMITFKKVRKPEPEFWKTWGKLKSTGSDITEKDIDDVVRFDLRQQIRRGAVERAERDRGLAGDWLPLENEL